MDNAVRIKIEDLFEIRQIPFLLNKAGISTDQRFYRQLLDVQASIYQLDKLLESEWKIDTSRLEEAWSAIRKTLADLDLKNWRPDPYLSSIARYQQLELNLRRGELSLELPIREAYYIKSCDVRLIRGIIYSHCPTLQSFADENDWVAFDLVTEVLDDLEDFTEDMETFNGSRFILTVLGRGEEEAIREYRSFLHGLKNELQATSNDSSASQFIINKTAIALSLAERILTDLSLRRLDHLIKKSHIAAMLKTEKSIT